MKSSAPLLLTKGKGEDEDESEKEEPLKKKGKMIITKLAKSSIVVFTRRSWKKGSDIVFNKPPPTFQEKLKKLEERARITNFKSLKYEIRIEVEKNQVEVLVLRKMGKWKYSPDHIASQVSNELLEKIKQRWDFSMQTVKDIYAQTLR